MLMSAWMGWSKMYITAPVVDLFIYPPRLRKILLELKRAGDLRLEGLAFLHRQEMLILLINTFMTYLALYISETNYEAVIIYIAFIIIHLNGVYFIANKFIIPCSIGAIANGKITGIEYHVMPLSIWGWYVKHVFKGDDGNMYEDRTKNISKKDVGYVELSECDNIYVLYDRENMRKNVFYCPGVFSRCCASYSQYRKYGKLEVVRN